MTAQLTIRNELLVLRDVVVLRDGLPVVSGVTASVPCGKLIALIGPAGSGKSSLLCGLAGALPVRGTILLDGAAFRPCSPAKSIQAGVVYCPPDDRVFPRLTVEDNLRVGGHVLSALACSQRVQETLDGFPDLLVRSQTLAGQLSGGERQQLAVARSLMTRPRLLLLDEPARGLSPAAVFSLLKSLDGVTGIGGSIIIADQSVDWMKSRLGIVWSMLDGRVQEVVSAEETTWRGVLDRFSDWSGA